MMNADNDTISFYNTHAADFVRNTVMNQGDGVSGSFLGSRCLCLSMIGER